MEMEPHSDNNDDAEHVEDHPIAETVAPRVDVMMDTEPEDLGISPGTLQVLTVMRRPWRHPCIPPLMATGAPSPIVKEFTRHWRVLRLTPTSIVDTKRELRAETTLLKNYNPRVVLGDPTFPSEIVIPGYLQPRVAVEDATAFLVTPRIRFVLGMIEPLVCRLVLYDVVEGCRVSEEFTFTLPSQPHALFYALPNHPPHHLYLVLKISKGLVGDADVATAPYCNPEKCMSEPDQQRLIERATENSRRLGRYWQPLAWGALPLVESTTRSMTLYRQRTTLNDEQRVALILEAARGGYKEKLVPAMCEFDIERLEDQRLDDAKFEALKRPTLELLDPFTPQQPTDASPQCQDGDDDSLFMCREVQPLCHPSAFASLGLCGSGPLAMTYLHALYVYPRHVDKFQYRNIAIRVQLLQKEVEFVCGLDEFDAQHAVIHAFYNPERVLVSSMCVQVNYHQKNPQFEDELKLCLPEELTLAHHLLFTFYHVHCKKLQPGQQQQELIGCCAIPMLNHGGALLKDGEYVLSVVPPSTASKNSTSGGIVSLSRGYVEAARNPQAPDGSRTTFTVRTRAVSSVRSQEPSIASCLEPFQFKPIQPLATTTSEQMIEQLVQLRMASSCMVRHFFLPLTRILLAYMRFAESKVLCQVAFRTLLSIFEQTTWNGSTKTTRNPDPNDILHDFVALAFDEDAMERCATRIHHSLSNSSNAQPVSTLQALVREWLRVLRSPLQDEDTVLTKQLSMSYAKIFLQLLLKVLALQTSSCLPWCTSREDHQLVEELLIELIEQTTNSTNGLLFRKEVNEGIAMFCRGLFLVSKSTLPIRIIHYYLGWTQRFHHEVVVTVHFLFPFLNALVEFEFFAIVNAFQSPLDTSSRRPRHGAWLARLIFERLLQVVDDQVEDRIRSEALRLLRRMFVLHVYNPRHQHPEQQELIALMYFPMIPSIARFTTEGKLLASSADTIDTASNDQTMVFRKELLICVAHLLSSVTLPYLSWYFRQSLVEGHKAELALSPTASLLHYRRLVEETKLRATDGRRQSLIQRSLDKAFAVTSPTSRAHVYDEIRVHACLALVRQVIEVFLVEESCHSHVTALQILSPDLVTTDRPPSLLEVEAHMKQRRSRHRGLSVGQDMPSHHRMSMAVGSRSPNPKLGPTAGSFNAGTLSGAPRLATQKSLPRSRGKNYTNGLPRASMTDSTKSTSDSSTKRTTEDTETTGEDYETSTRNLHRIIADTTLKAIRTAIDQFEWVIRIIESPLDYHVTAQQSTCGKITMEHAFTLLGTIVDMLFLLMKRASSIDCLCTATTSEREMEEEGEDDPNCFLAELFRHVQAFLLRFQRALFATRIAGLPLIHDESRIFLLVSLSASAKLSSVRDLAASLLCRLMMVCYEQTGSFLLIKRPLLKVFCTNFFSPSALQIQLDALRDAIDLWRQQSLESDDSLVDHAFELQLSEMLNSLTSQIKVFETWHTALTESDVIVDGEELEDGLYRIVQSVSSFWLVDVKTQWMEALIQLHAARNHFAEATCCTLESITFKEEARRVGGDDPESKPTETSVLELRTARELAQKANWLDKVVEIDERLLFLLRQHRRFPEYHEVLRHLDTAIQQLADNTDALSTQTFAFYRVVFAGDCVPISVASHEYVYKRSKFVSLGEFVGDMKAMLRTRFPICERVDIIPEAKPMPSLERNPNVVFMRVTHVEPLPRHEAVSGAIFRFSTPFTLGSGVSYGKTAEQMKRVVYLSTVRAFPSVTCRQIVASRREEVRCPIDNAMDDIQKRCGVLQDEIEKERNGRTDLKTLTLVLKGSVDTHVHGGIPEVIDAFLTTNGDQLPTLLDVHGSAMDDAKATDKREELADLLVTFLELCWVCLLISRLAFRRASNNPTVGDSNGSSTAMTTTRPRAPSSGTESSLSRLLTSVGLATLEIDTSSSPLQLEFEKSFGLLLEQLRTKVTCSYAREGDLTALVDHVQRCTRTTPTTKPSLSSLVLTPSTGTLPSSTPLSS